MPMPSWNISGKRKGVVLMAARNKEPPAMVVR